MKQIKSLKLVCEADMKNVFLLIAIFFTVSNFYCQVSKQPPIQRAPELIEMPTPVYPELAKTNKIEGKVFLKFDVSETGKVSSVSIFKSDNPIFDSSAVTAAKNAKFKPALSNGKHIAASIILQIGFELKSEYEKLINSAEQLIELKSYRKALDVLNNAIAKNPSKSLGYKLRADCFAKTKEYSNSRFDYRKAISLEYKNSSKQLEYKDALNKMTNAWYKVLDQKIEGYKRETAINKDKSSVHLGIAKCYSEKEEWEKAEEWYTEYFNKEKNIVAEEVIRYSVVLAKTGSVVKGGKILKKYTELFPEDWRIWSRYGYFSMWLGKKDSAKTAFETALKFKPTFREALDGLDIINRQLVKP